MELSESSSTSVSISPNLDSVTETETDQVHLNHFDIGSQQSSTSETKEVGGHSQPEHHSGHAAVVHSGSDPDGAEVDHAVVGEIAKLDLKGDDAEVAVEVEEEEREEGGEAVEVEEEKRCNGGEVENGNGASEKQSDEDEDEDEGENKSENENGVDVEKKEEEFNRRYQYPVRPEAEDCSFYLKTGNCKFGSNCKFNHPVRRKNNNQVKFTVDVSAFSITCFVCSD